MQFNSSFNSVKDRYRAKTVVETEVSCGRMTTHQPRQGKNGQQKISNRSVASWAQSTCYRSRTTLRYNHRRFNLNPKRAACCQLRTTPVISCDRMLGRVLGASWTGRGLLMSAPFGIRREAKNQIFLSTAWAITRSINPFCTIKRLNKIFLLKEENSAATSGI